MINYVIGPPHAGKSTYVRANKKDGDVVVDYDALAQAVGSEGAHGDHLPVHHSLAHMLWISAVRWAEHHKVDAWIIHAMPSQKQLEMYQRRGRIINLRIT